MSVILYRPLGSVALHARLWANTSLESVGANLRASLLRNKGGDTSRPVASSVTVTFNKCREIQAESVFYFPRISLFVQGCREMGYSTPWLLYVHIPARDDMRIVVPELSITYACIDFSCHPD
jgi:hypothetical protein